MDFNPFTVLLHWLADKIAGRTADATVGFLTNEPDERSGPWADFKSARLSARDGELEEAVRLAKIELEKEPENYEGLMLLASIYAQMGKHKQAIGTVDVLLKSSLITEGQVAVAEETREGYRRLLTSSMNGLEKRP